ncbi:MAG: hypothetical protein RDU14_16810 [Melioribacteraceae bacterium]|nr:hypothetical protein [Melioribacteraceae bacterium]
MNTTFGFPKAPISASEKLLASFPSFKLSEAMTVNDIVKVLSDGTIRKLVPVAFATPVAGTGSATPISTSAARLTDTTFVVAYAVSGTYAVVIGTVVDNIVSFGTPVTFSSTTGVVTLARLTDTSFVLGYSYTSSGVYCRVGTVSGTTISLAGTPVATGLWGTTGQGYCISALSSTSFVFFGYNGSTNAQAGKIGIISSGTTITFGAEATIATTGTATSIFSVEALTATTFVAIWRLNDNRTSYAVIGVVTGNAISSLGTRVTHKAMTSSVSDPIEVTRLTDTTFVTSHSRTDTISCVKIGTVTGTDIAWGTEVDFYTGFNLSSRALVALSATSFLIAYNQSTGYLRVCTVSGNVITLGTQTVFSTTNAFPHAGCILKNNLVALIGGTAGQWETVIVCPSSVGVTVENSALPILGFLQESGLPNQVKRVATVGNTISSLSGLTTGSKHYFNIGTGNGVNTALTTSPIAGTALSDKKLLIDRGA